MTSKLFNFLKLAAGSQEKLDMHFSTPGSDSKRWALFRRELKSKGFVKAIEADDRSDEKLKQYAKMVHLHKTGKGPSFSITGDTGKRYTVKYHSSIDRFTCSCPDWTIKHSVDGKDCKHIRKLQSQADMIKKAGVALRELAGFGRAGLQAYRTEGHREQAWHAGEVGRIHKKVRNSQIK